MKREITIRMGRGTGIRMQTGIGRRITKRMERGRRMTIGRERVMTKATGRRITIGREKEEERK